jgi:hypothetical protein
MVSAEEYQKTVIFLLIWNAKFLSVRRPASQECPVALENRTKVFHVKHLAIA